MFEVKNRDVGSYLSDLIDSKFDSSREFCKQWLQLNGEVINEDTIRNKANKLSQIKKGLKGIQTYDLPAFSELLGVSFEQILSAGKCGKVFVTRKTNYYIAQSQNKKEWDEYIHRADKPILCKDEFGINIIEYAIQFHNYNFIKYLMDNNYIWFDSRKDQDYIMTFGAGTSIQKINFEDRGNGTFIRKPDLNDLQYKFATEDQLRLHIISLAADNNDINMLEKLRAREIPELYYKVHYLLSVPPDFNANYDAKIIKHIAKSSDKILEYFTDSFEIRDTIRYKKGTGRKHTFVFPFISQLIDRLISVESPFVNRALEKMIAYNESVFEKIKLLIKQSVDNGSSYESNWKEWLNFYKNGDIVSYLDFFTLTGIITNVAHATKQSNNIETNQLIQSLNQSYDRIKNLKENQNEQAFF